MAGIESLLVGRVLGGRYRIEEVIGRGGMGAVYRALDERLGRRVALKVITVGGSGDAEARERLRARFFREARSAAALPHHPNVVPVYDYGSDEGLGLDYLVMELLRGSDLSSRLARTGVPSLPAALRILLEAARGVAVGHRQGLIHRDVKPGNIFLTETDAHEVQVRVVDFGIAKLADDEDTLAQLTQDGRVPHSPAYASPEQLRGLSHLTPASDVFSLGAVGYQLLTGERPYSETDRNRLSLGMPVEAPRVRERNPAVPGGVDAVIRKALAFDPAERFPDAGAMASELERAVRAIGDTTIEPYLGSAAIVTATEEDRSGPDDDRTQLADFEDDRTLLAPPPPPPTRAVHAGAAPGDREPPTRVQLPPRRFEEPRRGIAGILVWGLVLAVLAGAAIWGWSEMQRSPDIALELPPPPDTLLVLPPEPDLEPVAEPTQLDAALNNAEGVRFYRLQRFDSALANFQRAVEIVPGSAEYRRNLGLTLLQLGRASDAAEQLERAVQIDPGHAGAHENLGRARVALGDTTGAIAALESALQRETNAALQGRIQRDIQELRRAQEAARLPPLLGEPVIDPPDADPQPPGT
jgi:serine/threonine protein kinase